MSRPGCNRGCLLVIAASLLIDGLTLWAAVSLARMIMMLFLVLLVCYGIVWCIGGIAAMLA